MSCAFAAVDPVNPTKNEILTIKFIKRLIKFKGTLGLNLNWNDIENSHSNPMELQHLYEEVTRQLYIIVMVLNFLLPGWFFCDISIPMHVGYIYYNCPAAWRAARELILKNLETLGFYNYKNKYVFLPVDTLQNVFNNRETYEKLFYKFRRYYEKNKAYQVLMDNMLGMLTLFVKGPSHGDTRAISFRNVLEKNLTAKPGDERPFFKDPYLPMLPIQPFQMLQNREMNGR